MADVTDTDTGAAGGDGGGAADDQRIANMVNAAVSGHLKRVLPKTISDLMETHIAPIREHLTKQGGPAPAQGGQGGGAPQGGAPAGDDKYAALERKFQESEKARAAERMQGHKARAFDGVRGVLAGKARPDAIEAALKVLKADDRIGVREDGSAFILDGDEEVTIEEGVKRFMKSKEGALFAPAPIPSARRTAGPKLNPRGAPTERTESPAERSLRMIEERRTLRG
jgi:hypothetical protein